MADLIIDPDPSNRTRSFGQADFAGIATSTAPRAIAHVQKMEWTERLLVIAIVACTMEGALRKWVIPTGNHWRYLAYFSKDVLLCMCLLRRPLYDTNALAAKAKQWVLPGIAVTAVGCAIASTSANLVGAILTVRAMIVLPLVSIAIVPRLPRNSILTICWTIAVLAALNAPLGVVQLFSPSSSRINRYAVDTEYITTSGFNDRVRATGTFSYITGYGVFADIALAAGLILLSTSKTTRQTNLAVAGVLCALVCAGSTVSRSVMLIAIVMLAVWAILSKQRTRAVGSAVLLIAIGYAAIDYFGLMSKTQEIFTTTQKRHQMVGDSPWLRIMGPFIAIPQAIGMAPFGNGVGTEQVGGNYYASGKMALTSAESDWSRTIFEIGAIGFAGGLMTYLGTIYAIWSGRQLTENSSTKTVFLVVAMTCAAWYFTGVLFNHVSSFYFWVMAAGALAIGNESRGSQSPTLLGAR